jgi:hypothetical protein
MYKNHVLPVVLYGCETWSLTLREYGGLEQGAEKNVWIREEESEEKLEKTA